MKPFRLLALIGLIVSLTACRFDVDVDVVMAPDGTGDVTVRGVADAELVTQMPDLFEGASLDDAIANGWTVAGPSSLADGSVEITLSHDFASAEELANVLRSIGPPLSAATASRVLEGEITTNTVGAQLVLPNGFRSFADDELIATVGDVPFADEFAASGATPPESMSFTVTVDLPGELVQATGTELPDGSIEWTAPLDGSTVDLMMSTTQEPASNGAEWAGPVSRVALFALVAWLVVAAAFIGFVAVARGRRRQRRPAARR